MPDDNQLIFDFMKNLETENFEITDTSDKPMENAESVYPQNQEIQAVQQINQPVNNNQHFSLAASVINAVTHATCVGKYIQIPLPHYSSYAKVICDQNCNTYLGILNQHTNQYKANGIIVLENSEYVVYQDWKKVGTLRYNSFEDSIWYFVPVEINVHQQIHNTQYPAQNNQQIKYTFNNVPPEHDENIVNSIMVNKPQNSVEVNFSSSTMKSGSPFISVDELKTIIDILPK